MTYFRARYPPVQIVRKQESNAKKFAPRKLVLAKSMFKFQMRVLVSAEENGVDLSTDWGIMAGWKLAQISFIPCLFIKC